MELIPSVLGINYQVHPGGFFNPPTHRDGMFLNICLALYICTIYSTCIIIAVNNYVFNVHQYLLSQVWTLLFLQTDLLVSPLLADFSMNKSNYAYDSSHRIIKSTNLRMFTFKETI